MSKCPFLTTIDEDVECFKECSLYKWVDNSGKCPFNQIKELKPFMIKSIQEYNLFNDDKESPLGILCKESYV